VWQAHEIEVVAQQQRQLHAGQEIKCDFPGPAENLELTTGDWQLFSEEVYCFP